MFRYAAGCLVIALVAACFGFSNVAAGAADIARTVFYIFLIVAVASFAIGLIGPRK